MSAQHTPGPWVAKLEEAYYVTGPDLGRVAMMTHLKGPHGLSGRRSGEESAANARLIAAAPDLLEALRALHAACVKDGWPAYGAHPAAMNAAIAAIAKAADQKGGA